MELDSFEKDGVTYFRLYISCPVDFDRGKAMREYWSHYNNNCDGDIYVGENAFYYCKKCKVTQHVYKWRYHSPWHSSVERCKLESVSVSVAQAVSTMGQMVKQTGLAWLREFLVNMEKGC